jgi:hypothetical protein
MAVLDLEVFTHASASICLHASPPPLPRRTRVCCWICRHALNVCIGGGPLCVHPYIHYVGVEVGVDVS